MGNAAMIGDDVGAGIVVGGDRMKALAVSRRHTRTVRALRWLLPVACLALIVQYTATAMQQAGVGAALSAAALQKILPTDLKMQNPHYEGFAKDGTAYVLDAKSAQQDLKNLDVIKLEGIEAKLSQAGQGTTLVKAAQGVFNHKSNVLELAQSIDVMSESGLKATLTQATITTKDGVLVSKQPVVVEYPSGTIRSNGMTLLQKRKEIVFAGSVETVLKPQAEKGGIPPPPVAGAAAEAAAAKPGLFKSSSAPVTISSETLVVKDTEKLASFKGGVRVVQEEGTLTTPQLDVSYDGGAEGTAAGAAKDAAAGTASPLSQGKVRKITAKGPVVMTQGADQRVEAASAEFDVANEAAVLDGNVVISGGADQNASGDRVELDQRNDTALLTGAAVVVQQGTNELKGRRLFIDRKAGRVQLTSPPGDGLGPGRIAARFSQGGDGKGGPGKGEAGKKAKGAGAADAGGGGGFASFKTDPNAPIDIAADALDVDDNKHVATFRGDVQAVQGEFVIRTAELVAAYSGGGKLADVTATQAQAAASGGKPPGKDDKIATELTRIDARKNVVVTSKDGNMARGDWATFDAKANTVTVGGDVTLSKGGSMVRGTRLVIDMANGETTIDTAPNSAVTLPGTSSGPAGGWAATTPGAESANRGRPSAVLFPKALRDAQEAQGKQGQKPSAATSGWSAETAPGTAPP